YFKVTHFEDYLSMLDICTQITGDKQAYEHNGAAVQAQIEKILSEHAAQDGPSVLLMITYSGGIRPQGADTMTGRMLDQMGWRNILDDYPSLLRDFSIEKVIEIDPDYILVIPMGNDEEALRRNLEKSVESNPAWKGLSAVVNDRYILLPGEKFVYKPNARWAESYAHLAGLLRNAQMK
ncbi:MAG: ABC transporter substrate-binding protein, partial [Clostridia bacterium]|nr:ABC transporter substrate-binding protein [Clostridia bacterium]